MSVDEFLLFAIDVLDGEAVSESDLESRINIVFEEMKIPREKKEEQSFDITGLKSNFVLPYIKEKYGIDDLVVEKYNEKKTEIEEKKQRRVELEKEIGIIEYDIQQINYEIAMEKKEYNENSKEVINDLYKQIAELKVQLKDLKNQLYYL